MANPRDAVLKAFEEKEHRALHPVVSHRFWGHGDPLCPPPVEPEPGVPVKPDPAWEARLKEAVAKLITAFAAPHREKTQAEALAQKVEVLWGRVERLERAAQSPKSITVSIQTVAPEPYEVVRDIQVVVQPSDDEYLASFFDANINAAGCNEVEAVDNLKDVLVGVFEYLSALPQKRLGPGPARQLAVLRQFIRKGE